MSKIRFIALLGFLAGLLFLSSCGGSNRPLVDSLAVVHDVVFSVANQDEQSPVVSMKVSVDGRPVVYGEMTFSEKHDYIYVNTQLPEKEITIRAFSEAQGEIMETSKLVVVREHMWVVVTRTRDLDGEPEMRIEVSYEIDSQTVPRGR